jgi:hypothetical protein
MAVGMKITAFCIHRGGSKHVWNVTVLLGECIAQYSRGLSSSKLKWATVTFCSWFTCLSPLISLVLYVWFFYQGICDMLFKNSWLWNKHRILLFVCYCQRCYSWCIDLSVSRATSCGCICRLLLPTLWSLFGKFGRSSLWLTMASLGGGVSWNKTLSLRTLACLL